MSESHEGIRAAVRDRFAAIAATPEREKRFPIGPESVKNLGYGLSPSTACLDR